MPHKNVAIRIHVIRGRTARLDLRLYSNGKGLEVRPVLLLKSLQTRKRTGLPRTSKLETARFSTYQEFLEIGLEQMKHHLTTFEGLVRSIKNQKSQVQPALPKPQDSEMDLEYG